MSKPIPVNCHNLLDVRQALQVIEINRRTSPLHNWTATRNPEVDDDLADGYTIGSWWNNTTTGELWLCTDAARGAAVWENLGAGGTGSIASPSTNNRETWVSLLSVETEVTF